MSKFTSVCTERVPFHLGAYFCMGAYKRNVVAKIKMGAYIHGVLVLWVWVLIIMILRYFLN